MLHYGSPSKLMQTTITSILSKPVDTLEPLGVCPDIVFHVSKLKPNQYVNLPSPKNMQVSDNLMMFPQTAQESPHLAHDSLHVCSKPLCPPHLLLSSTEAWLLHFGIQLWQIHEWNWECLILPMSSKGSKPDLIPSFALSFYFDELQIRKLTEQTLWVTCCKYLHPSPHQKR